MNSKLKINFTKILIVSGLIIGLIIYGVCSLPSMQQIRKANNYYKALKNLEYDKAFDYLLVFDKYVNEPSKYTVEEAKSIYLNKMSRLQKEKDYKIVKVSLDTYTDDGIFFVSANLEVEIDGQKVKYSDLLKFNDDNKLFIDASNDTYSKLRDGRLDGWKDTLN